MKKSAIVIISLIVIICLTLSIKNILRYRFGYFVEGPELKYEHRDADVLKLENGNVLILGKNAHSCLTPEACKDNIMPVVEVPSEIYNAKTNKIEELRLPNNIRYRAKGILLENDRLLLTYACKFDKNNCKDNPYPYNLMLIVNLNTRQIEKVIEKKYYNTWDSHFVLLDKDKLLVVDSFNKIWEVYNLSTGKSKVLKNNIKINCHTLIPKEKEKALAFGNKGEVYEYDNKKESIKHIANLFKRGDSLIKRINENELLIIGGRASSANKTCLPIEIYNKKTNISKIVAKMPDDRAHSIARGNTFSGIPLNDKYFLIAGGDKDNYPFETPLRNLLILDLSNYKIKAGPKLPYNITTPIMFNLSSNKVLIMGGTPDYDDTKTLIFTWEENK